jgi:hypothetical protein
MFGLTGAQLQEKRTLDRRPELVAEARRLLSLHDRRKEFAAQAKAAQAEFDRKEGERRSERQKLWDEVGRLARLAQLEPENREKVAAAKRAHEQAESRDFYRNQDNWKELEAIGSLESAADRGERAQGLLKQLYADDPEVFEPTGTDVRRLTAAAEAAFPVQPPRSAPVPARNTPSKDDQARAEALEWQRKLAQRPKIACPECGHHFSPN